MPKIHVIVEYKTGGGHGEADAVEEDLRNLIENLENPTRFRVLAIWTQ